MRGRAACRAGSALVSRTQRTRRAREEILDGEQVLLGERLRRRHQRALVARLDRAEERVQRDDGLAGADVALEQALHRPLGRKVGIDLRDRAFLVLGQRNGSVAVALDQRRRERRAAAP